MNSVIRLACLALCSWTTIVVNLQPADANHWRITDPPAQQYMLALARRAFDTYATNRTVINAPSPPPAFLMQRRGVFISTMYGGAPRTCMGTLYPLQANLANEIIENAVASAGRDRRFPPVRISELPQLDLIVSIVDTPRPISESQAANLDSKADGLVVQCGARFGVVLSGETPDPANLIKWGRIRAGARPNETVEYFEIHDVRFMESQFK